MSNLSLKYKSSSAVSSHSNSKKLNLSPALTKEAGEGEEHPYFQGQFRHPFISARILAWLHRMISKRWYDPAKAGINLDPIITSGHDMLRFEGFSGCRSVYIRADFLPESLDIITQQSGTTNVDFNEPMQQALSSIEQGESLSLHMESESISMIKATEVTIEKKVKLPLSWLKGLASIPILTSQSSQSISLNKATALRLFHSLPPSTKANERQTYWLNLRSNNPRISRSQLPNSIKITGIQRLAELGAMAHLADSLTIASSPDEKCTIWTLHCQDIRLSITISPEIWRGFSGEGATLSSLAENNHNIDTDELLEKMSPPATIEDIATMSDLSLSETQSAIAQLSGQGLVGYDSISKQWFQRLLPKNELLVSKTNPRLVQAEKLFASDAVVITENAQRIIANVTTSANRVYDVVIKPSTNSQQCTCYWHTHFGTHRGACSHILATQLKLNNDQ